MTPERLKVLNQLRNRVEGLELSIEAHRAQVAHRFDDHVTPTTRAKTDKLIEQDLEEQLAIAKREFEQA